MKHTLKNAGMLCLILFVFGLVSPINLLAQKADKLKVVDIPEVVPSFPGGQAAMYKFLQNNIKYPMEAQRKNIQGRVVTQFIINDKGQVIDPVVVRSVDPLLDAEALRVISIMPKWYPGKVKNRTVNVRYTLPIDFSLRENTPQRETPAVQNHRSEPDLEKHLPLSDGLPGMWRQVVLRNVDGEVTEAPTGNYKVLNKDNTFYTFVVWSSGKQADLPTTIGFYGNYTITSDSTFTEKIIEHTLNPAMSGTESELRFRFADPNTLVQYYKLQHSNQWIPELWRRVELNAPQY